MRNRTLQYLKSNKQVILSIWQTVGHYSFMLVPLMFPAFELFYKFSGKTVVNSFSISAKLIFVLISLVIGYFKWRELSYYQIEKSRTDEEFKNAVLASANKLNWIILKMDNSQVKATAYHPWRSRDQQTIQIERQENKVQINSMTEPGFFSVPDFFGVNRTNRNTFFQYYDQSNRIENLNDSVIQQLKEAEEKVENESEWNLKNTLKRITAYIFCLAFLSFGITVWIYEGFSLIVLILCLLGSSYLILDIYVMWTKKKQAHSKRLKR